MGSMALPCDAQIVSKFRQKLRQNLTKVWHWASRREGT